KVTTFEEDSIAWDTGLTPEFLAVAAVKSEHLALSKLWEYITYLQEQQLEAAEYQLTFWQKILQPLAILGMVLIAISFIFGPLREVPMSLRLTTGIIAGLLFHYGQQFVGHMSMVLHVSPVAAAAAPPVLCCILGVWLLLRIRSLSLGISTVRVLEAMSCSACPLWLSGTSKKPMPKVPKPTAQRTNTCPQDKRRWSCRSVRIRHARIPNDCPPWRQKYP